MVDQIFCCSSIQPYRSQQLDHEKKFSNFMAWASASNPELMTDPSASGPTITLLQDKPFIVQLIQQVSFGPIEYKKYFAPKEDQDESGGFVETTEMDLVNANFQKLNS